MVNEPRELQGVAVLHGGWAVTPIDFTNVRVATVLEEVAAEREKQRAKWGDDHDDEHESEELADAAALLACSQPPGTAKGTMPLAVAAPGWAMDIHLRVETRREECVIAAALLIAEIERLDRLAEREAP